MEDHVEEIRAPHLALHDDERVARSVPSLNVPERGVVVPNLEAGTRARGGSRGR